MTGYHPPLMKRTLQSKEWLTVELMVLFVAMPVCLTYAPFPKGYLFPVLWIVAAICLMFLWRSRRFERKRLWNLSEAVPHFPRIVARFVVLAALLVGVLMLLIPPTPAAEMPQTREQFREAGPTLWTWFGLIRARPELYAAIMVLYPIFSVLPQNVIYRVFFFHRYSPLLGERWRMVAVAGATFGLGHLMFGNWVAPTLTALGGFLMMDTYRRSRSAAASWFEHTLYGCFVWTLGIGRMFYYNPPG